VLTLIQVVHFSGPSASTRNSLYRYAQSTHNNAESELPIVYFLAESGHKRPNFRTQDTHAGQYRSCNARSRFEISLRGHLGKWSILVTIQRRFGHGFPSCVVRRRPSTGLGTAQRDSGISRVSRPDRIERHTAMKLLEDAPVAAVLLSTNSKAWMPKPWPGTSSSGFPTCQSSCFQRIPRSPSGS
jgi:hypothetical protein